MGTVLVHAFTRSSEQAVHLSAKEIRRKEQPAIDPNQLNRQYHLDYSETIENRHRAFRYAKCLDSEGSRHTPPNVSGKWGTRVGYDFSRFSPQSFERFAQALATSFLGPGVQVYGSGPDGGREASFEGKLNLSTHGTQWDGYVVVQAKYRAISKSGTDDAVWLEKELSADLAKFEDSSRGLRKPQYYLAITNVSLTSVQSASRKGGQQKLEDFFESKKKSIGLKGWLIWHADTLTAMLDNNSDVRTRYAAWITEGDVLATVFQQLQRPSVKAVLPLALKRDLRKDRDVRRKDAGQITEKRIFLEDVFVDLPLKPIANELFEVVTDLDESSGQLIELEDEEYFIEDDFDFDEDDNSPGLVASLLARSADKLDAESLSQANNGRRRLHPTQNRIVLLGGPGQGKSTVGQFLVQIARARITIAALKALPPDEASEAAEIILARARSEGLDILAPARYPLHIELPKFADALKQANDRNERLSILRFAAEGIAKGTDVKIDPTDLREWLGTYPWLLVLDGLDEVPPTGNRADVILAINEFWDDVHEVKGDVMVIVTTRPQGYGDDLPRRHWEHWSMANLSPKNAMRFAKRLSEVLLSDGARRDEILGELKRASEDPATAPIMISPLQVSILFTLVETRGGVPADRWSLFQRHYHLLRDREAAKEGSSAKLLREFASQIDQVHYDAGFLLHVRAENAGSADAYLEEAELRHLIFLQLSNEGHDTQTINDVTNELVRIATDRLVLLGSKVGGRVSFDVRSLQEFMAAARIMSSPEQSIQDRLRDIAAKTHWRHVFRIAASKAFALTELSHFRKNIIHICDALDKGDLDSADQTAQSGARLALELLLDNVAARLPEIRRALVARAMEIVRSGPEAVDPSLIHFLDQDTLTTYNSSILAALSNSGSLSSAAATKIVVLAINSKPNFRAWAEKLLVDFWPADPQAALRLATIIGVASDAPAYLERIETSLSTANLAAATSFVRLQRRPSSDGGALPETTKTSKQLQKLINANERKSIQIAIRGEGGDQLGHIAFRPLFGPDPIAIAPGDVAPFPELSLAYDFLNNPSKKSLAALIRNFSLLQSIVDLTLPWPARLLITERRDYAALANDIESGLIGDTLDWHRAEERWNSSGVSAPDFNEWSTGSYTKIASVGIPNLSALASRNSSAEDDELFKQIFGLLGLTDNAEKRRRIFSVLSFVTSDPTDSSYFSKDLARALNDGFANGLITDRQFLRISRTLPLHEDDLSPTLLNIDSIGRDNGAAFFGIPSTLSPTVAYELFVANPNLRGLLPFTLPNRGGRSALLYPLLNSLPNEAFSLQVSDSDKLRLLVKIFRWANGMTEISELDTLVNDILHEVPAGRSLSLLNFICNSPSTSKEMAIQLLDKACAICLSFKPSRLAPFQMALKSKLDSRHSRMSDRAICDAMSLPHAGSLNTSSGVP